MYKVSIRSIRRTKELCVRRHVFSHHAPAITASTSWPLACMRAAATRSVSATHSRMSTHAVRCPLWACSPAGAHRPSHALGTLLGASLRWTNVFRGHGGCGPGSGTSSSQSSSSSSLSGGPGMYFGRPLSGRTHCASILRMRCSLSMTLSNPKYSIMESMCRCTLTKFAGASPIPE